MTDLIAEAEGLLLPWEKTFYDSIWPSGPGARGKSLKSKAKATVVLARRIPDGGIYFWKRNVYFSCPVSQDCSKEAKAMSSCFPSMHTANKYLANLCKQKTTLLRRDKSQALLLREVGRAPNFMTSSKQSHFSLALGRYHANNFFLPASHNANQYFPRPLMPCLPPPPESSGEGRGR